MSQLKLMTVVGTRPEIIRLSEVIKCADRVFDHYLVHTGQNYDYELSQVFFDDLSLRAPDAYLGCAQGNVGHTIARVIESVYDTLVTVAPDALLVLGDTNSCLGAIAAKRLHIPLFHMEAGNRCFDERLPEETNRRIVDHIADVNICYSEHARRNLLAEGMPTQRTFVCGSPMAEVLKVNKDRIASSEVLKRLELVRGEYMLVSAHREENIDDADSLGALVESLSALAEHYGKPLLYSLHPRSKAALENGGISLHPLVRTHVPLSFSDYNHLQMNAFCVVSDSGTLPEEAAYFSAAGNPFAAVCLRTSTERPEAFDAGVCVLGSLGATQVVRSVELAVSCVAEGRCASVVDDYATTNVSSKVVKLIQSYTSVVNEMVWRKG